MERKTLAKWLVVSALACCGFGLLSGIAQAQDGTTIQGTQSSDGAVAETGEASGENSSEFGAGPSAEADDSASAQQLGNNKASVRQSGSAKSGDPVAGGQVTGVVGDNVTVQNQNTATDAEATSGDTELTNDASIEIGAFASADVAQVSQAGNNELDLDQVANSSTGDAVAGAQVTGIVGGGEHTVQNQNSSDGAEPTTGDSSLENAAEAAAGLFAEGDDTAQAGQIGDNDAVISQASEAGSGDSVGGSQVTGVVGGSATVQNQNRSVDTASESGSTEAFNTLESLGVTAIAGPQASADAAQATQQGDNAADVAQDVKTSTGDALAGSQVTGGVGDSGGFFTVQNQQASEDDEAISGDSEVGNDFEAAAGPEAEGDDTANASQLGDNNVTVAQSLDAGSGDALAGAQVTGAVGHHDVTVQNQNFADGPATESGTVESDGNVALAAAGPFSEADVSQAAQSGNNGLNLDQVSDITTGDAVSGGQVTGVVSAGSTVTVQNQNTAIDAEAVTGDLDLDTLNELELFAGALADGGGDTASASQLGDNTVDVSQDGKAATGDAVAGGQVTGIVADDAADVTVQNQNSSDASEAETGELSIEGNIALLQAGPSAPDADVAQSTQSGDNALSAAQNIDVATGDAVAGGQVTGAVTGGGSDVTFQNQNNSIDDTAETGAIDGGEANAIELSAGPFAGGADTTSNASQIGDNDVAVGQNVDAATGDAVAGGQIAGLVSGDHTEADIQQQNFSEAAEPISGDADFDSLNLFESIGATIAGPDAGEDADAAQATQNGNNSVDLGQAADVSTGDAVGAGQVTGAVVGHGSDLDIQNQNACSDCAVVETGSIDLGDGNDAEFAVGPAAEGADSASASQLGDNQAAVGQAITAGTGDAVAGSQVTGAVAGGGSDVTVQNQNTADSAEATTGDVDGAENTLAIDAMGPTAISDGTASASQVGDNALDFGQVIAIASGDAVAGSQVTGIVGVSDGIVQVANSDVDSEATSGDASDALNDAEGELTPFALGADNANAALSGDSAFDGDQSVATDSGDAVAGSQINGGVGDSGGSGSSSSTFGDLATM